MAALDWVAQVAPAWMASAPARTEQHVIGILESRCQVCVTRTAMRGCGVVWVTHQLEGGTRPLDRDYGASTASLIGSASCC